MKITKTGQNVIDTLANGGTLQEVYVTRAATKRSGSGGSNRFWLETGVRGDLAIKIPAGEIAKLQAAGLIRVVARTYTDCNYGLTQIGKANATVKE
jgi:hypothetical protein